MILVLLKPCTYFSLNIFTEVCNIHTNHKYTQSQQTPKTTRNKVESYQHPRSSLQSSSKLLSFISKCNHYPDFKQNSLVLTLYVDLHSTYFFLANFFHSFPIFVCISSLLISIAVSQPSTMTLSHSLFIPFTMDGH